MPFSDSVTQGGQTFLHKLRMVKQIARLAIFIALFFSAMTFVIVIKINTPISVINTTREYLIANWKIWTEGEGAVQKITDKSGVYTISSKNLLNLSLTKRHITYLQKQFKLAGISAGIVFFLSSISIFFIWSKKGNKDKQKSHISGQKICSWRKLRRKLILRRKASNIKIGKLPLLKNSETKHIFISGTTGSGKTNCFYHLLSQARSLDQKAIIVDTTGDYVSRFYRKDTDILLNPLDKRSLPWHPWIECTQKYHFQEMARNFIPTNNSHDPFWTNSARVVFASALEKMSESETFSTKTLLNLLTRDSLSTLYLFLKDSDAASLIDPTSDKTATSIRSTVSSYVNAMNFLEDTEKPFSIRKWVQDDQKKNWLFLSMLPDQRDALRPIISAWTSIAIKSLLGCKPDENRRLWFFMDELPTLHKINDLSSCLAESRKYGGCVVLGLQNMPQLEDIYGPYQSKTIIDLCSTKFLFRMASYDLAHQLSKALGERETSEIQEGISYGANEIRDGVSLSRITKERPTVSPTDLLSLEDLETFIKMPGNFPLTKIKLKYQKITSKCSPFVS